MCYDYCFDGKNDDDRKGGADGVSDKSVEHRKQQLWEYWRIDCKCRKCCMNNKIIPNALMASDPIFCLASQYKRYLEDDSQQTLERLKMKCVHFLRKFKDEAWTKEMEIVTKVYSQCILDEYNRSYGPPDNSF